MDLSQKKLSLSDWNSIEVPVSDDEKKILQLIISGVNSPDICINNTQTLLTYVKVNNSKEMEYYLFQQYFLPEIQKLLNEPPASEMLSGSSKKKSGIIKTSIPQVLPEYKTKINVWLNEHKDIKTGQPNKANLIRLQQTTKMLETNKNLIFEYVLIELCKQALVNAHASVSVYTLLQLLKYRIANINEFVRKFVLLVLCFFPVELAENKRNIFHNARECIEKNKLLIQYEDLQLYTHQKDLFQYFNERGRKYKPCLVLYTAPTGTGKTLSPLGLSEKYKVIFVCVARHVGMSLAKSAISVGKRIGFAFGCETSSDIRLHNYSASNYIVNKRSGGIGKIDHSIGSKVEIMICDVSSYITAMHYMLAFHESNNIILYWDEPTITMDYDEHELHATISRNWRENKIPKMVLSCATLPKQTEIESVILNFCERFTIVEEDGNGGQSVIVPDVCTIDSFDCKKTITLVNKECYPVLPHLLFEKFRDINRCVEHCNNNKTLLRYFDVAEIVRFVEFVQLGKYIPEEYYVEVYFRSMADITMNTLKQYYLDVLRNVDMSNWSIIYTQMRMGLPALFQLTPEINTELKKYKSEEHAHTPITFGGGALTRSVSVMGNGGGGMAGNGGGGGGGIYLTTKDAYTLTDGPTIFLAEDVEKVGKFYLQQTQLPEQVLTGLIDKINKNTVLQEKIKKMQKDNEDKMGGMDNMKDKKAERELCGNGSRETRRAIEELDELRNQLASVSLNATYIPNTAHHQEKWLHGYEKVKNAFVPNVGEEDIKEIMGLSVDNQRKILLILGIGVFSGVGSQLNMQDEEKYMEIMKRLAYNQRLYLIIASSDYIYGTNYQFCHGFLGKDLTNMTQQKIIQAIGRIGRTNIQQEYSVRFRDDDLLLKLLKPAVENKEAIVMNRLAGGCGGNDMHQ